MYDLGDLMKTVFVGIIILSVIIGGLGVYLLIKFFGA